MNDTENEYMGFFANREIEVMDLALDGVDIYSIARVTELPISVVEDIINGDPDYDIRVDADQYADDDAIYFGAC